MPQNREMPGFSRAISSQAELRGRFPPICVLAGASSATYANAFVVSTTMSRSRQRRGGATSYSCRMSLNTCRAVSIASRTGGRPI